MQNENKIINELLNVLRSGVSDEVLREKLSDYHAGDVADALELLSPEERKRVYSALGEELISDVFSYVEEPDELIEELSPGQAADIIENMDADDAVDVLDELDEDKKREIIALMEEEAAEDVKLISTYDDDQIGSEMTTNFVSISNELSVKQAMREVIKQAADNDNISTVYVTDAGGVFCGAIELRDLVIARSSTPLADIIIGSYPYLYASDKISDCIEKIKDYAEDSLPVLDADNRLIGALTSVGVAGALQSEMNEDYAKLAAVLPESRGGSILKSVKKRLPWLILLLVLDLIIGAYTGVFEGVIAGLPFLVFFQQMILGMSGNVGTQSLAVTVKALTGEISAKQKLKLISKETQTGLFGGLIIGVISACAVFLYCLATKTAGGVSGALLTALCVGAALVIAMTACALTGTVFPIILKKFKADPAVASGPLITTVNDLVSVTVYYSLAYFFLAQL